MSLCAKESSRWLFVSFSSKTFGTCSELFSDVASDTSYESPSEALGDVDMTSSFATTS